MGSGGIIGIATALAFVLGLVFLAARLLARFAPAKSEGASSIPLSVIRRISIGPRQGIALVRINQRVVAVSIGDGGVRTLAELDEITDLTTPASQTAQTNAVGDGDSRFRRTLSQMMRSIGMVLVALSISATGIMAQSTAPVVRAQSLAAAQGAASGARIDSMLPALAPQMQLSIGQEQQGGLRLSGTVGIVVMMGLLTMLPMLVLMMTAFTRILIVMHFLRQAIGAQSAPPAQLVAGLALLLTLFVMGPTLAEVNRTAISPWMDGTMQQGEMLTNASQPFRTFMLAQTREQDIETFLEMSGHGPIETEADIPLIVLTSAFVTSELRVAFQIGFALFLPFIVIDIVVASVLMSVGMMMVPPAMISLPFKLLLFVLVDGWTLVIQSLVRSFA